MVPEISNVIIYDWLYWAIKRRGTQRFITSHELKTIITRILFKKNGLGGFPNSIYPGVIEDMINLQLIKRINLTTYQILKSNCYKRINNLIEIYC